jgi:hypothetical protein
MIKWEALDKPKEFGGLGFIDTKSYEYCSALQIDI